MIDIVAANLRVRPLRTLISIVGVALGVVLIVLFTGLATGMSNDMARRAANWKAEIIFTRPGATDLTSSNTAVNIGYVKRLAEIEGVDSTVPIIRYLMPNTKGRWGIQQLDGLDWEPFAQMNDIQLLQGRSPRALNEVIIDDRYMRDEEVSVGDTLELFGNQPYTIVGVFSPPSGARIKMSLAAMQDALETKNASYILVKVAPGYIVDDVAARIDQELPGNKITLTRDVIIDAQERIPSLKTFLNILVGLGAFVSTIFVLLSMYTTVTERRKEIGILKSLGASKLFIIKTIEGEAFMIGVLGIIAGVVTAFVSASVIEWVFEIPFEFSMSWVLTAILIALAGSLIGALYPAWRASAIDPVEVMANE
ncbi:MAG: ABC transporter permease [Blastocatellia bacterium]|nr:ABC transporter permease [Blastocatellia bacterium]